MLGVEVFGRVLVFRGITAADVATGFAQPKVDPGIATFKALLTPVRVRLHVLNLIRVGTFHGLLAERTGVSR